MFKFCRFSNFLIIMVLIVGLVSIANFAQAEERNAPSKGDIAISVVSKEYLPLAKADILLDGEIRGKTGDGGLFYIQDVKKGEHEVVAKKKTYDSTSKTVNVKPASVIQLTVVLTKEVNKKPEASIMAPSKAKVNKIFQVSGESSKDPDGQIKKYEWSFSKNGNFGKSGKQVEYKYGTTGQKVITLKVTDNKGRSDQANFQITVIDTRTATDLPPKKDRINIISPVRQNKVAAKIWTDRYSYSLGDKLHFYVKTSKPVYCYLLDYLPNGKIYLVYPYKFNQENRIKKGITKFPPKDSSFSFQVAKPLGIEYVQMIASTNNIDIFSLVRYPNNPFKKQSFPNVPYEYEELQGKLVRLLDSQPQNEWISSMAFFEIGVKSETDQVIINDSQDDSSGPSYTEIEKVGMVQSNSDQAVAKIWLKDSIPNSPPSYIGYVWPLDTDSNGDTGQVQPNNIGSEYNLRVAYSPENGWGAYIDDILRERTIRVKHFDVDYSGGIVSMVFPLDKISNPSALRFMGSIAFRRSRPDFSGPKYIDFSY